MCRKFDSCRGHQLKGILGKIAALCMILIISKSMEKKDEMQIFADHRLKGVPIECEPQNC